MGSRFLLLQLFLRSEIIKIYLFGNRRIGRTAVILKAQIESITTQKNILAEDILPKVSEITLQLKLFTHYHLCILEIKINFTVMYCIKLVI